MYRVTTYLEYGEISMKDFALLHEAEARFEEEPAFIRKYDHGCRVELIEFTPLKSELK